ncbi:hypothetical protein QUB70_32795, partial [Microcoleus sp. A003_D6]|uniref:hypothetical protein n=1 Tax=Microcoleus sp. A003_D6 TaxID=3055266 RepID=UPI002FCF50BA
FTLYLDSFDEVNSALSFQTILFSRFRARFGESLLFRRFINVSTLPRVVKHFAKIFLTFFFGSGIRLRAIAIYIKNQTQVKSSGLFVNLTLIFRIDRV